MGFTNALNKELIDYRIGPSKMLLCITAANSQSEIAILTLGWNKLADTPAPYTAWSCDWLLHNPGKRENILFLLDNVQWPQWGYVELQHQNQRCNSKHQGQLG